MAGSASEQVVTRTKMGLSICPVRKKKSPYNEAFFVQAFSDRMPEHWPGSFLRFYQSPLRHRPWLITRTVYLVVKESSGNVIFIPLFICHL